MLATHGHLAAILCIPVSQWKQLCIGTGAEMFLQRVAEQWMANMEVEV